MGSTDAPAHVWSSIGQGVPSPVQRPQWLCRTQPGRGGERLVSKPPCLKRRSRSNPYLQPPRVRITQPVAGRLNFLG